MTNMTTEVSVHKFERAGMGHAPYRFVGVFEMPSRSLAAHNPDGYNAALASMPKLETGCGTCACCGMPIMTVYIVKSADGRLWGVGCECINKTHGNKNDRHLSPADLELAREVDRARREHDRKVRHAREEKRIAELDTLLADPEVRKILASMPHPDERWAAKGQTYLSHVMWYRQNAGNSGCIATLKRVREILGQ